MSTENVNEELESNTPEVTPEPEPVVAEPEANVVEGMNYASCEELAKKIKIEHLKNFKTVVKVSEATFDALYRHKQINLNGSMNGVPVEVVKGAVEDGQFLWG